MGIVGQVHLKRGTPRQMETGVIVVRCEIERRGGPRDRYERVGLRPSPPL